MVDWDGHGREQRIDVLDPATVAVLDARTVADFVDGRHLAATAYDDLGSVLSATDPLGTVTAYTADILGRTTGSPRRSGTRPPPPTTGAAGR